MEPAIVAEHLHKRYPDAYAVRDVSFSVKPGEIFGILGPNGAGKTTTVEMLEGLRKRDSGTIRILGLDPTNTPTNCGNASESNSNPPLSMSR